MKTTFQDALSDPVAAIKMVETGMEWGEVEMLAEWLDVPAAKLGELLLISPATMTRRKTGRFDPAESDRVLRFARLWNLACDSVGGVEGARSWLKRPQYGLNGAIPLEIAKYESGAREVEALLGRILYGVLA